MTPHSQKTEQKWLHSSVLALPKWLKIPEKLEKHACGTNKTDDLTANAAVRVENAHENSHGHHNTSLLGKYPEIQTRRILLQMREPRVAGHHSSKNQQKKVILLKSNLYTTVQSGLVLK